MNKKQLFDYFDQKISMTAIQNVHGDWLVTGKFCRIGIDEDGLINLWICNHKDTTKGLGTGKLRNILSTIKSLTTATIHELTGEAWVKLSDKSVILTSLPLLGIRKKKVISQEHFNRLLKAA